VSYHDKNGANCIANSNTTTTPNSAIGVSGISNKCDHHDSTNQQELMNISTNQSEQEGEQEQHQAASPVHINPDMNDTTITTTNQQELMNTTSNQSEQGEQEQHQQAAPPVDINPDMNDTTITTKTADAPEHEMVVPVNISTSTSSTTEHQRGTDEQPVVDCDDKKALNNLGSSDNSDKDITSTTGKVQQKEQSVLIVHETSINKNNATAITPSNSSTTDSGRTTSGSSREDNDHAATTICITSTNSTGTSSDGNFNISPSQQSPTTSNTGWCSSTSPSHPNEKMLRDKLQKLITKDETGCVPLFVSVKGRTIVSIIEGLNYPALEQVVQEETLL
jgi:hypothetical protein